MQGVAPRRFYKSVNTEKGSAGWCVALDGKMRQALMPHSTLTGDANLLVLPTIDAANIDNRFGRLEQSGTAATLLALAVPGGVLDNRNGTIAGNGVDFTLSAHTLLNGDGRIAQAGSGVLSLSASALDNPRGALLANGAIRLAADALDNRSGAISANRLDIRSGSLLNAAGEILQGGPDVGAVKVAGLLDNTGGRLAAGGDFRVDAGSLLNRGGLVATGGSAGLGVTVSGATDNSAAGRILAGGLGSLSTGRLDNTDGQLAAGQSLVLRADGGIANLRGLVAAENALSIEAAGLDNTDGSLQALRGALGLDLGGELANRRGLVLAGGDLHAGAGSLDNSGTLYAGGNAFVAVQGEVANSTFIGANGSLNLTAGRLASAAASLLGAGIRSDGSLAASGDLNVAADGTLSAVGQNLAGGRLAFGGSSVDLSGSRTQAGDIVLYAAAGDILTADARIVTPGTLALSARSDDTRRVDNRRGELLAGHLDIQAANLDWRVSKTPVFTTVDGQRLVVPDTFAIVRNDPLNSPVLGVVSKDYTPLQNAEAFGFTLKLPVGQRIGSYVIAEYLGEGGTSEVYLVRRESESFALKILKESTLKDPAALRRFKREAEAAAKKK